MNPVSLVDRVVSGYADIGGEVEIYVDGELKDTVTANNSSVYSAIVPDIQRRSLVRAELATASTETYKEQLTDMDLSNIPEPLSRTLTAVDSFLNNTTWTLQSSGTNTSKAPDTVNTRDTQSINVTAQAGAAAAFIRNTTFNANLNSSVATGIDLSVFVHDIDTLKQIVVYISNSTTLAGYATMTFKKSQLKDGFNEITQALSALVVTAPFDLANPITTIQVRIEPETGMATSVSFDNIKAVKAQKGNVVFTMDDQWITQYTQAYRVLDALGLKGSVAVIQDKVGAPNYMSEVQLREIYGKGWDLLNHTKTHPRLGDISKAAQEAELLSCKTYLDGKKFVRSSDTVVYPYGSYNDDTMDVLADNGFTWGRSLIDGLEVDNPNGNYLVRAYNLTPDRSAADAQLMVDKAIATGSTIVFLNHKFGTDDDLEDSMYWTIQRIEELAVYVKQKLDENKVNVLTVSEWLVQERV
ncbi:polysaccharide deacetylase family protein [Listeria newyorkensis]